MEEACKLCQFIKRLPEKMEVELNACSSNKMESRLKCPVGSEMECISTKRFSSRPRKTEGVRVVWNSSTL